MKEELIDNKSKTKKRPNRKVKKNKKEARKGITDINIEITNKETKPAPQHKKSLNTAETIETNIDEQQRIETKVIQIMRNKDGKTTESEYKHAMTYMEKAYAIDYRFDSGTNYLTFACQLFPNSKPVVFKRVHLYDLERMDNLHSIQTTRTNAKGREPSKLGMQENARTAVNKDRNHMMTLIKAKLNLKDNPTEWLPAMGLTKGVVIEILHGLGPAGKVAEREYSR